MANLVQQSLPQRFIIDVFMEMRGHPIPKQAALCPQFLRNCDHLLTTLREHVNRTFPGDAFHRDIRMGISRCKFGSSLSLQSRALRADSDDVSVWRQVGIILVCFRNDVSFVT